MLGLGPKELIILAGILVLLFGSKKVPELARSIGDSVRELRKGFSDVEEKGGTIAEEKGETTDKKDKTV